MDFSTQQLAQSPLYRNFRRLRNLFGPAVLDSHSLHQPSAPPLNCASSTHPTSNPHVIIILGAGFESADIPLDELDLREPQNFSLMKVTVPANQNVVFIHNHPGEVKTEIFKNGWGGKALDNAAMLPSVKTGMSPETSGERRLVLDYECMAWWEGSSVAGDVVGGLTVAKTGGWCVVLC
jgi:hypothetical protein